MYASVFFPAERIRYSRLQFTSNIRECVRVSVERARYFICHAKPRKTKRKSQNGLPCVCVAFKRIRLFYAHTHAFTDVRSEAQSTVANLFRGNFGAAEQIRYDTGLGHLASRFWHVNRSFGDLLLIFSVA